MDKIGYLSECDRAYTKALTAAETLADLRTVTQSYEPIAADAHEIALRMTEDDFKEFRKGLMKERRGKFAGEAWADKYMAVMLPATMFGVSEVAVSYCVPFGLAYIRMRDAGRLVEDARGVATLQKLSA